jgi:hypothetical protein
MKKEDRLVYLELCNEINFSLCQICTYVESCGGRDDGFYCTHPLLDKPNFPAKEEEIVFPGTDCWAFIPSFGLEDFVQVVGMVIEYDLEEFTFYHNKEKQLVVKGNFPKEILEKEIAKEEKENRIFK